MIRGICPNIRSIMEERQTLTPLDLERRFGITGGNIFHGEMSLDQMFVMRPLAGWAKYRTPIQGLCICAAPARIPAAASWVRRATMPPEPWARESSFVLLNAFKASLTS